MTWKYSPPLGGVEWQSELAGGTSSLPVGALLRERPDFMHPWNRARQAKIRGQNRWAHLPRTPSSSLFILPVRRSSRDSLSAGGPVSRSFCLSASFPTSPPSSLFLATGFRLPGTVF